MIFNDLEPLRLRWLFGFQGEFDDRRYSKRFLIDTLGESVRRKGQLMTVARFVLEREGHSIYRPESWELIFTRFAKQVASAGMLDRQCMRDFSAHPGSNDSEPKSRDVDSSVNGR